jgi:hypothetical protein
MSRIAAVAGLALSLAAAAAAAPASAQIFGGPNIGTLGIGADLGLDLNDFVAVRVAGNYLAFEHSRSLSGVDYSVDVDFRSVGGTVDFYPFALSPVGGGMRFSAGARWNGNQADFAASSTGAVTIGNTSYAGTRVEGDVEFGSVAGYAGLGYVFKPAPFARVALDAGILFQGAPKVTLRTNNAAVSAADLRAEERQIEDELDFLRYYPVVTLSVFLHF